MYHKCFLLLFIFYILLSICVCIADLARSRASHYALFLFILSIFCTLATNYYKYRSSSCRCARTYSYLCYNYIKPPLFDLLIFLWSSSLRANLSLSIYGVYCIFFAYFFFFWGVEYCLIAFYTFLSEFAIRSLSSYAKGAESTKVAIFCIEVYLLGGVAWTSLRRLSSCCSIYWESCIYSQQ